MLIICDECGKEISDKAAVCPNCGNPINNKTELRKNSKDEISINRDAMLIYLRNMRDLMLAYTCILQKKNKSINEVRNKYEHIKNKVNKSKEDISNLQWKKESQYYRLADYLTDHFLKIVGLGFVMSIIASVILKTRMFFLIWLAIIALWTFIGAFIEKNTKISEIESDIMIVKNRGQQDLKKLMNYNLQNKEEECIKQYEPEESRVKKLIYEGLQINLIPKVYRNLSAVQYIYEYMCTSNVSFEFALRSAQIEEGIKRIESKLNTIISQQSETIFQNRKIEAQNESIIEKNKLMLEELKQINSNTEEAKYYTEIMSNYSAANAYFSLANCIYTRELTK